MHRVHRRDVSRLHYAFAVVADESDPAPFDPTAAAGGRHQRVGAGQAADKQLDYWERLERVRLDYLLHAESVEIDESTLGSD